jgi:predicted acetyltransferase
MKRLPDATAMTNNRLQGRIALRGASLDRATPDMAPLLQNLLELYVHDLSEIFPVELGPDGRFGYARLPLYWTEPAVRHAFLIKCGSRVAGFALATRGSPASDDPTDLDVAEFFVLRAHRRSGVGRQAAFALWDSLPGQWVVRVSETNRAGLPFWSDVIRSYTSGVFGESARPGSPAGWRIFTFASTAQRSTS